MRKKGFLLLLLLWLVRKASGYNGKTVSFDQRLIKKDLKIIFLVIKIVCDVHDISKARVLKYVLSPYCKDSCYYYGY